MVKSKMQYTESQWCNGNTSAFQAGDSGSNPGWGRLFVSVFLEIIIRHLRRVF